MLFLKIILTVVLIDLNVQKVKLTESMFDLMGIDFQE
jgi:hypothetical protein